MNRQIRATLVVGVLVGVALTMATQTAAQSVGTGADTAQQQVAASTPTPGLTRYECWQNGRIIATGVGHEAGGGLPGAPIRFTSPGLVTRIVAAGTAVCVLAEAEQGFTERTDGQ